MAVDRGRLSGWVLDAVTGNGLRASIRATGPSPWTTTCLPDGSYSSRLFIGSYSVRIDRAGYLAQTQTVQINARECLCLNIDLQPSTLPPPPPPPPTDGTVSGIVTRSDTGAPIAGAHVMVGATMMDTDSLGRYSLQLPAGDQPWSVSAANFTSRSGTLTVVAGQTATLNVLLDPLSPPPPPPSDLHQWSSLATWQALGLSRFPTRTDRLTVPFDLVMDADDGEIGHLTMTGRLIWGQGAKRLRAFGNVIMNADLLAGDVTGPQVGGLLQFVEVNEAAFQGGGMNPLDSDVGLWVMGAARLLLYGEPKRWMARATGSLAAGAQEMTLDADPVGWRAGDEVVIAPMNPLHPNRQGDPHDFGYDYDLPVVSSVSGRTVRFQTPLQFAHPAWTMWGQTIAAEVVNLTRSFRIEGTPGHKAHVFVRSSRPHDIQYVAARHLGPMQPQPNPNNLGQMLPQGILGRWGGIAHLHHCMDGSRGTLIHGCVDRDSGGHGTVLHASHGITMREHVMHTIMDDGAWWDQSVAGDASHDNTWEDVLVSDVRAYDPNRGFRLAGFNLAPGSRNRIIRPVAFGVRGFVNACGATWPEIPTGIPQGGPDRVSWEWEWVGPGVFHHCNEGLFGWQNKGGLDDIQDTLIFACYRAAVDWGAYGNPARFTRIQALGCGVGDPSGERALWINQAADTPDRQTIHADVQFDGEGRADVGFLDLAGQNDIDVPVLLERWRFRRFLHSAIRLTVGHGTRRIFHAREWEIESGIPHAFWLDTGINPDSRVIVDSVTIAGVRQGPFTLRPNLPHHPGVFRPEWNAKVAPM